MALTAIEDLLDMRINAATTRNWSRVATVTDAAGSKWLAKQFVSANGDRLDALFAAELEASRVLADVPFAVLNPLKPSQSFPEALVLLYEFVEELAPLDVVADRGDLTVWRDLADRLEGLLGDLRRLGATLGATLGDGDRRGERAGDGELVGGWKGLDIKNLALASDGRLFAFDFGPVYRAPIADPVARLVASTLLARWGRPVSRTLGGPPRWFAEVCRSLIPATTRPAVDARLDRLLVQRRNEPQGRSAGHRLAGRTATRLLGPRYWSACRALADDVFSETPVACPCGARRSHRWIGRREVSMTDVSAGACSGGLD